MLPMFELLLVYCVLVSLASLAGGRLSLLIRMTHLRTQLLMSGVGGLMLGIAMLHMWPHSGDLLGSQAKAGVGALIGLIVMFLLIRLFHTHDHSIPVTEDAPSEPCEAEDSCIHSHNHAHGHVHNCEHGDHAHGDPRGLSWVGLFFGLALHTLVDGVALASSVMASSHGVWMGLAGLGTFLAVALHKPLDAFAITSVMDKQRWSASSQATANFAFSLACPAGALAFFFLTRNFSVGSTEFLGWGLAISAGFFIGIALADLLPEVAFHDHDRGKLTFALLFGVALAVAIENLPGHSHQLDNSPSPDNSKSPISEPLGQNSHPAPISWNTVL